MTGVELMAIGSMSISVAEAAMAAGSLIMGLSGYAASQANADAAKDAAAADADRMRREKARMLGQTRVGIAKSGVQLEGTPLMVLADNAAEAELDIRTRLWEGDQKAAEHKRQAMGSLIGGVVGAGTSIMGGGFGAGASKGGVTVATQAVGAPVIDKSIWSAGSLAGPF